MGRSLVRVGWIMLAVGLGSTPAWADERAEIEAACVELGLGAGACSCIAEDTMAKFEPRMREVIFLSLSDEITFGILMKSGQITQDEVAQLNAYQEYIEPVCKVGQ
jgi:hypothetical protein